MCLILVVMVQTLNNKVMKSESSKLLVGLGLGTIVGIAIGYYMTGEHRQKLEEDLHEVGHGIKDGVKSVFSKVKAKAEHAGSEFAGKAGEWSEKAGDRAEDWSEKAGQKAADWSKKAGNKAEAWSDEAENKISGAADNLSQKANDLHSTMGNKAQTDAEAHNKYAQDFRQDVNEVKDRMKSGKNDMNTSTGSTKSTY